ncbi:MAG TPA: NADH-quinone oxidoreductase subunit N [Myxococcaceae bacterium]|jgi:NADH-quinone oxidoreductase subunit N|nr:NADH-quinone oxidoreductase subunit N [Myxococcaceae bacterium]
MLPLPNIAGADFTPLWPALVLSVAAILLLVSEAFLSAGSSRTYQALLTVGAALLAGGIALGSAFQPARAVFLGFAVLDPFGSFLTAVACLGLLLAALLANGFLRSRQAERGEFYALTLFSTAGMSLLAISSELITLFVNLEVLSIATYALASFLRRGPRPAEAGFKYFILGAFSSALLLYGTALLYGATGTTVLSTMGHEVAQVFADPGSDRRLLVYCGAALVAAGLAFKVAAVPFHMWTPDVYEGAPTPVTALMSVGVKAAAFAALVRVFVPIGRGLEPAAPVLLFSTLAILTMVVGNLLALPQRNVKRMLAYSSISHAGYLLVGVTALFVPQPRAGLPGVTVLVAGARVDQAEVLRSILFYLLAYTVTAAGAFGLVGALERREDETRGFAWDLDRFSGLAQRRPAWAWAMTAFMLSLGGIPPMVGFMAKLLVFRSAVDAGLVGLVVVGVLTSAVGAYYYLRVVVYMFMRPPPEQAAVPERLWSTDLALALTAVAVVLLGVAPALVSRWLGPAGQLFAQ